uniref:Uncharacterized protein n=1 Tax=Peromyscus maniculatus bairdii TaxID=230844 RepID=A0A8C8W563_PERMB
FSFITVAVGAYRSECHILLSSAMVMSGPGLQLGAMSGSVALLQPGSVLMSVAPVAIEGHADSWKVRIKVPAYREELELERLLCRRRPGDRDLLRTGDRCLGERDLLLIHGGDLCYMGGGGGSILLGGLNRRGGGRGQGANTAVAVISWPSICPPSMCFSAFSASSGFSNSTYVQPLDRCILSTGMSIILIFPKVENISMI